MSYQIRNRFREKIEKGEFVISVEVGPQKWGDLKKNYQEVALCAPFVDAVDVTDSSMANLSPCCFVVAAEIQRKFDVPAIFNYTCRDRNVLGLKSDLAGALILGVENVLCLTGDPPVFGDHPKAKPVYEINSSGLLEICKEFGSAGRMPFAGAAINFNDNKKVMEKAVELKVKAGAQYFISQPVYTKGRLDFLKELSDKFRVPVIAGILPIKSFGAARYMQEKVVGITIPDDMYVGMKGKKSQEIFDDQIEVAKDLYQYSKKIGLAGAHFMPLGRGDKIPDIIGHEP